MKTLTTSIVLTLATVSTACGSSGNTQTAKFSEDVPVPTNETTCSVYARDVESMRFNKTVDPARDDISDVEKAMIQTVALLTIRDRPLTPDEAVAIFTDRLDGRSGSLGGDISYAEILVNGAFQHIARVVYYPGDNEYGAIFRIRTGHDGSFSAKIEAYIGDSDVYCLTYAD